MPNDLSINLKRILKGLFPAFLLNFARLTLNAMKRWRFIRQFKREITSVHRKKGQAIIILATPVHGNLGDHAIVYAEKCLLTDQGLGDRVIEVAGFDYALCKKEIRRYISNQDLILIDGGGNLGTLWPWEDDKISEIISSYRNNPIVVFPQTCFYDGSPSAQERLVRNKSIYASADNLLIALRDRASYVFCRTHFNEKQFVLVPDIVLYLYGKIHLPISSDRVGILLCFRTDLERTVSQEELIKLKAYLRQQKMTFKETNTVLNYDVDRFSRQRELNKLWTQFASARLVITDRLHGMIFAAINGTPCLALDNVSRKVSGVYEVASGLEQVKICQDISDVMAHIPYYMKKNYLLGITIPRNDNYLLLENFIKEHIQDQYG